MIQDNEYNNILRKSNNKDRLFKNLIIIKDGIYSYTFISKFKPQRVPSILGYDGAYPINGNFVIHNTLETNADNIQNTLSMEKENKKYPRKKDPSSKLLDPERINSVAILKGSKGEEDLLEKYSMSSTKSRLNPSRSQIVLKTNTSINDSIFAGSNLIYDETLLSSTNEEILSELKQNENKVCPKCNKRAMLKIKSSTNGIIFKCEKCGFEIIE